MDMFHEHSLDPTIWIQSNFFQEIVNRFLKKLVVTLQYTSEVINMFAHVLMEVGMFIFPFFHGWWL